MIPGSDNALRNGAMLDRVSIAASQPPGQRPWDSVGSNCFQPPEPDGPCSLESVDAPAIQSNSVMNMNEKITAEQFLDAFREQWKKEDPIEIRNSYQEEKDWTGFMLGTMDSMEKGFLYRVSEKLSVDMGREWYTLDCVYYKMESSQVEGHETRPARLCAIIEHENSGKVAEEMWKLLLFGSPLKILIFYDYREDEKENCELKKNWLDSNLEELLKMGSAFGYEWPEGDDTEYLFLVGSQVGDTDMPRWSHMSVKSEDFVEWPISPQPSEFLQLL